MPETVSSKKQVLSKISGDGQDFFLLVHTIQESNAGFHIILCDGQHAWKGSVSKEDLKKQCDKIDMDFNEYTTQTRKALCMQHDSQVKLMCLIKKEKDDAKLIWKKYLQNQIKFQLGEVLLKAVQHKAEVIKEIFNASLNETMQLEDNILSMEAENARLLAEREMALKKFEKCVQDKISLEEDLFTKFLAVLNSKKTKINELQKELSDMKSAGPSHIHVPVKPHAKKATRIESSDDTDVEDKSKLKRNTSDQSTDDEAHRPPPKKKQPKHSLDGNTSLILGKDNDSDDNVKPSTKRPRRRHANDAPKAKTPSKPTLPRVSKKKTPDIKQRPTISRKSSRSLTKSSIQLNDSDLFDDL